jgi:hypothetical protein
MRLAVACCAVSVAAAVAGCAFSGKAPDLPASVGNGVGSEYGNYAARMDGETRGPSGERCVVYDWDRPIGKGLAIRYRSLSCDAKDRPGWMVCTEVSRTVIPIAESNLRDGPEEAPQ